MRPGLSSLKDFISKLPMEGLSSRPMKNWDGLDMPVGLDRGTHVIDVISRVSRNCEQLFTTVRHQMYVERLEGGHEERGGYEPDPFLIQESEGFGAVLDDDTGSDTECKKEGGERWRSISHCSVYTSYILPLILYCFV